MPARRALAARAAAGQPHACNLQTRIGPHSAWVRDSPCEIFKTLSYMSVYVLFTSSEGVAYYNEFVPHVGTIVSRTRL